MKRYKVIGLGIALCVGLVGGVTSIALAAWPDTIRHDNVTTIAKDHVHKGSLYAVGDTITIDGVVDGTVYCAANHVKITGTVHGDVLCAGQDIRIDGSVENDVRLTGQFVKIDGQVGGSASVFAQDMRLGPDGTIKDDLNGASQSITLDGMVHGDVVAGGQMLTINNAVNGDISAGFERLDFGEKGHVQGDLSYTASMQQDFTKTQVNGVVSYNQPQESASASGIVAVGWLMLLSMVCISAVVIALCIPRFLYRAGLLGRRRSLTTTLIGFATVFGGPLVVVALLMSVILVPLGLALLFAWLAVLILSVPFFIYLVGGMILRSQNNVLLQVLVGAVAMFVAGMIPLINGFVVFVAIVFGSGMIIVTVTNGYRRPQYSFEEEKKTPKKSLR
jgi:cytoskeletal protein CcmA (bactofilin family)